MIYISSLCTILGGSSSIEVIFNWGLLHLRSSLIRSSFIEVIFNWGCLPFRLSSIEVGFHWKLFWTNFLAISGNLEQLWFFSFLTKIFCTASKKILGGGRKVQKSISTNFLAISGNFEQLWFFHFQHKFFVHPPNLYFFWGGGTKKSKNHFRPIFLPIQAILNNFDFFSWQIFF